MLSKTQRAVPSLGDRSGMPLVLATVLPTGLATVLVSVLVPVMAPVMATVLATVWAAVLASVLALAHRGTYSRPPTLRLSQTQKLVLVETLTLLS